MSLPSGHDRLRVQRIISPGTIQMLGHVPVEQALTEMGVDPSDLLVVPRKALEHTDSDRDEQVDYTV